ncbi:MAG: hypothetical protein ABIL02_07050 [candidate division WOR-3 bacterium]
MKIGGNRSIVPYGNRGIASLAVSLRSQGTILFVKWLTRTRINQTDQTVPVLTPIG